MNSDFYNETEFNQNNEENNTSAENDTTAEENTQTNQAEQKNSTYSAYTQEFFNHYYSKALMIEKPEIKRSALVAGFSFLSIEVVMTIIGALISFGIMSFGNWANKIYEFLYEPAIMQIQQIVFSIIALVVPVVVIYKIGGYRISELVNFKRPQSETALPMFLIGVSFCSFANIAVSYASNFFRSMGIDYSVDFGENPQGIFGFLLSLIATVITPALIEEFICRGILMGSLRKFGDGFAIITSAVIFGIMHGNFSQIPFAFLVGLILGYIVIKTGSIWVAVAVHGFNNFVSLFFEYALGSYSEILKNLIYTLFLSITLALGLIFLLKSNKQDFFKLEPSTTECTVKEKYRWFFTSVPVIIFIVISIIGAMKYFVF